MLSTLFVCIALYFINSSTLQGSKEWIGVFLAPFCLGLLSEELLDGFIVIYEIVIF